MAIMSHIGNTPLGLTYDSMKKENNSQQIIVFFLFVSFGI